MANPPVTSVQNLLPVQAYFDVYGTFQTFIGQGVPFYATTNPSQSGLNITNSTINSTTIGATTPSTGVFTNIATTTGTIASRYNSNAGSGNYNWDLSLTSTGKLQGLISQFNNNKFILFEYTSHLPETIQLLKQNNIKYSIHTDELDLNYIIICHLVYFTI